MTEFKIGDAVRRKPDADRGAPRNSSYPAAIYEPCTVVDLAPGSVQVQVPGRNPTSHWMYENNAEHVGDATTKPRSFRVGDVVTLRGGSKRYTITDFRDRGNGPEATLDSGGFDYVRDLTLVPTRKLGETPVTVNDSEAGTVESISIDDPRIAWIWADLATYADGKNWCSDYDDLAKAIGIPGRVKKWTGSITLAETRIAYTDIEADSQDDANRIFREQIAAELNEATK
jgi:hypothetical protein